MPRRSYDALVLDLDGTLVQDDGSVHPDTHRGLRRARDAGVVVMVATGRSEAGSIDLLRELDLDTPAAVYNGAALYCPRRGELIQSHTLGQKIMANLAELVRTDSDLFAVVAVAGDKFALPPRDASERTVLETFSGLRIVSPDGMNPSDPIRVSLFSDRYSNSQALADRVESSLTEDAFLTHFPMALLPQCRDSRHHIVDVQPPCRGKAEALAYLEAQHGIPPSRVVAIGDSDNDIAMLEAAGLGVAMGNALPAIAALADRVIGDCNSPTIARLIEEVFLAA